MTYLHSNDKNIVCFGESILGLSHLHRDTTNQDALLCSTEAGACFLIVADGHGGKDYFRSNRGALFATFVLKEVFKEAFGMLNELEDRRDKECVGAFITEQTVRRWRDAVKKDIDLDPFDYGVEDYFVPYGTTCVGFAIGSKHTIALQIGDGDLFLAFKGERLNRIFEKDQLDGEQTYSLCLPDAEDYCKVCVADVSRETDNPEFVFLATDGFAKSFFSIEDATAAVTSLQRLFLTESEEVVRCKLKEILTKCAMQGSCDDTTGVVYCVVNVSEAWVG